jgi:hypothetical protein
MRAAGIAEGVMDFGGCLQKCESQLMISVYYYGADSIAARTAIAAVGGGVGSKLAGGSFADGAYSAAFFHLFSTEIEQMTSNQQSAIRSEELGSSSISVGFRKGQEEDLGGRGRTRFECGSA